MPVSLQDIGSYVDGTIISALGTQYGPWVTIFCAGILALAGLTFIGSVA